MIGLSFLWILIACALYGVIHSCFASMRAKTIAERRFGKNGKRFYRLFYTVQSVITLIPVMALMVILPDNKLYSIPFPVNSLTIALQLAGCIGLLLGVSQTGGMNFLGFEQAVNPAAMERPSKLVQTGFYGLVRHPLYTFGLLILWLTPMMTWNLLALNIGLTGYILVGIIFEERKLEQEFGETYRDYKKRTPMLFPWFTKKS